MHCCRRGFTGCLDNQVPKKCSLPSSWTQLWSSTALGPCPGSLHGVTVQEQEQNQSPRAQPSWWWGQGPCHGPALPSLGGCPAEPDTVPGILGRVQPAEPHEQGLGTGPAATQLLPATNKGCLMPGTAGRLWLSGGAWHCAGTTTTSLLLPMEQGHSASPQPWAQGQDVAGRFSCPPPAPRAEGQLTSSRC